MAVNRTASGRDSGNTPPEELRRMQEEGGVQTKEEFKKKYFEYYDDVKDKSLKRQDW